MRIGLTFGGLVACLIFVGALAAGCNDDGGGGEITPFPAGLQDQLRRMVLQDEDVPAGFRIVDQTFSTNQELADATGDPEAQLARLQQWGRIAGHDVTYEPGGGGDGGETIIFSLNSTVSIYQTADGARASFADAANGARTTDWTAFFGGAVDIEVEEVQAPAVADEILWLRVRGKAEATQQTFAHDAVLMRVGTVRGSIQAGSFGTDESKSSIERLIRLQAEHMLTAMQ